MHSSTCTLYIEIEDYLECIIVFKNGIAISHSCIFNRVHLPIHHQHLLSTDRRRMSCTVLLFTLVALRFICHAISHIILPSFLCLSGYFSFFYRRLLRLNGKPRIFYLLLSHWDTYNTHRYRSTRTILLFSLFFCNPAKINVKCRKRCFAMTTRSLCHTRVQSDKEATTTKSSVPSSIYNKPRAIRHRLIRGTPEHE